MGEANMCQTKWNEDGYVYKNVYNVLKSTLERNDTRINEIGTFKTFFISNVFMLPKLNTPI